MEYHLMCQSRIEKPGENITPSCGHGQKVDFFFFNERFEFVEQIVFFLYQRTRDLITRIMFFEIIFHSGQPDIVPHIFLRLDMYKMYTETERGKKTHKGIYRQQILLVEIGEKGYAFYVFKSHERHIFGNCQNRYACRFENFGRNAPYQIALFTTFPRVPITISNGRLILAYR